MKRSCEDLGLCQARTPACLGCQHASTPHPTYPFAPDVIDGAPARKPARPFGFRATDVVGAMALVALTFFLAGWLL